MHLLITDSGLGGLSVCAETERALRGAAAHPVRITYFNSWPEEASGYNDMPDIESRARVFDRALAGMAALKPDCIVIACNTLSIVYAHTRFRHSATIPVLGIVDAGVERFFEALTTAPHASIVLFGTRTTIESGAHRTGLVARGIAPERISAISCHGLARAIEMEPDGETITGLIEQCTKVASQAKPIGKRLVFGVCCTHYTYVSEQMRAALERHCGRPVQTLDPNHSLVASVLARVGRSQQQGRATQAGVTLVSKVTIDDGRRGSIARRVQEISPATAAALLAYTRVPDLF